MTFVIKHDGKFIKGFEKALVYIKNNLSNSDNNVYFTDKYKEHNNCLEFYYSKNSYC